MIVSSDIWNTLIQMQDQAVTENTMQLLPLKSFENYVNCSNGTGWKFPKYEVNKKEIDFSKQFYLRKFSLSILFFLKYLPGPL